MLASLINYIGIPYSEMDCWDLAKHFYINEMGTELSDLDYTRPEDRTLSNNKNQRSEIDAVVHSEMEKFKQVTTPKFGDIILLRVWGMPAHVGVYIDAKRFLHTQERTDSVLEPFHRWEKRILGYYRWQNLS